jgi:PTH1 family peptidyl-tRNA hydrolase
VNLGREQFHGWAGSGIVGAERVLLLKPTTFMNRSGQAVLAAGRFHRLESADLLVISDDFALPLGRLRLRARGSAGSHNGLSDIVNRLGTEDFARLRIGIGGPVGDPARYVLDCFAEAEEPIMRLVVHRAADAVESWLARGVEAAMNEYNGLPDLGEPEPTS